MGNKKMNCKHGVDQNNWVTYNQSIYGTKHTGCEECIKENIRDSNSNAWIFMGLLFGMGFSIVGMVWFWLSTISFGLQWWNGLGIAVFTTIVFIPWYLSEKENCF